MEKVNAVFILLGFFGVVCLGIYIVISGARRRPGEKYFEDEDLEKRRNNTLYNHFSSNKHYMPNETVINPAFKDIIGNIYHDKTNDN